MCRCRSGSRCRRELAGRRVGSGLATRRYFRPGQAHFSKFRNTKIEHLNAITTQAVWFEPDVVGFQIPVDDALLMRVVYRRTNLFENIYHPVEWKAGLFGQHVTKRAAVEIFHYE